MIACLEEAQCQQVKLHEKGPKDEAMKSLYNERGIDPANTPVIGDDCSEIKAGTEMGSVTISRLEQHQTRASELHTEFGTNYITQEFASPVLGRLIIDA